MSGSIEAVLLGLGQVALVVGAAPLMQGVIRKLKARLQSRSGPPLLQSYHDLGKLFARSEMLADSASIVQIGAPWVVLGSTLAALLFVPVLAAATPLTTDGGLLVVIGLLALGRAALMLGGLDSGSTFGQMGTSREMAVGVLVEPALLLALASLALGAGTTQLGQIAAAGEAEGAGFIDLQWGLALLGLIIVALAETGRIPVDNPDTHLELTMIHEAMLLEYSGRSLGVLHLAAMTKQILFACLIGNLFFPFGLDGNPDLAAYLAGGALLAVKVTAVAVLLGLVESLFAKMRMYELPDLLGSASFAGLVAVAVAVWQL